MKIILTLLTLISLIYANSVMAGWEFSISKNGQNYMTSNLDKKSIRIKKIYTPFKVCRYKKFGRTVKRVCE